MSRCPVCGDNSCRSRTEQEGITTFDCPRCGGFTLPTGMIASLSARIESGAVNRSALSHHIRLLPRSDDRLPAIGEGEIAALRPVLRPLTPREQQHNLILWLGDNQHTPGQFIQARKKFLSAVVGCHVTAQGLAEPELDWLVNQMKPLGLFDSHFNNQPSVVSLRLTLKGWDLYAELRGRAGRSRQAFMPMPSEHAALDRVVNDCFRPVAVKAGFDLVAQNGFFSAAVADERVRGLIRTAPFVLADVTRDDAGVLFAAGLAEGLGLPVIYTCEHSQLERRGGAAETRRAVTIPWRIEDLEDAGHRLAATLRAAFPETDRRLH
ncbi:MAG: hypothetical protein JO038_01635 [Alphaproteobacteria bacterium]|nr:hypothetical protein [Alphaproteobacteria bacterium]